MAQLHNYNNIAVI